MIKVPLNCLIEATAGETCGCTAWLPAFWIPIFIYQYHY